MILNMKNKTKTMNVEASVKNMKMVVIKMERKMLKTKMML
jgi:hypothetical protein